MKKKYLAKKEKRKRENEIKLNAKVTAQSLAEQVFLQSRNIESRPLTFWLIWRIRIQDFFRKFWA